MGLLGRPHTAQHRPWIDTTRGVGNERGLEVACRYLNLLIAQARVQLGGNRKGPRFSTDGARMHEHRHGV